MVRGHLVRMDSLWAFYVENQCVTAYNKHLGVGVVFACAPSIDVYGNITDMRIMLHIMLFLLAVLAPTWAWAAPTDALAACEPYRGEVEDILIGEGVDPAYYYLMVAESRCRPRARSGRGAAGHWQLMPATARAYGCGYPDDLPCATRAAARYILHLMDTYRCFDDVIIAYNMGGRNYRKYGASREARGLVHAVHILMEADK